MLPSTERFICNCRGLRRDTFRHSTSGSIRSISPGGRFARLSGTSEFGAPIALEHGRFVNPPSSERDRQMELQDSGTPLSNFSPTIVGLWNRLKSTADSREDSLGSRHTGNTGKQAGPAWANPESAQEQAPLGPEFFQQTTMLGRRTTSCWPPRRAPTTGLLRN